METIGQYLKTVRQEKEISLHEIAENTKINVRRLELVEANKLKELGGYGHTRAAVITYTRFIKADEKKALYLFEQTFPSPLRKIDYKPIKEKRAKAVLLPPNFFSFIFLGFLVIIMVWFLYDFNSKGLLKNPFKKTEVAKTDSTNLKIVFNENTALSSFDTPEETKTDTVKANITVDESFAKNPNFDFSGEFIFEGKNSPLNYSE